jgi:uncharacterized membrane protein YphA (DoxX/SURF4 family)
MSDQAAPLRRPEWSGIPLLVIRLALGGFFVYMGLKKAVDPVDFMKLIREYQMVPDAAWWGLNLVSVTLPWVEVVCGLLLLTGVALRGAALTLLVMLLVFTPVVAIRALGIYQASDIAFCDIEFDCGCGAGIVNICWKLPENITLMLLSLFVLASRTRRFCLRRDLIPTRLVAPDG